jgi:hypothetical protein
VDNTEELILEPVPLLPRHIPLLNLKPQELLLGQLLPERIRYRYNTLLSPVVAVVAVVDLKVMPAPAVAEQVDYFKGHYQCGADLLILFRLAMAVVAEQALPI